MANIRRTGGSGPQGTKVEIFDVAVIGAGASGCMAAAAAAQEGDRVLLLDANDKIGRKIYATGNGRCNLTNLHMADCCYHVGGGANLSAFFSRFSVHDHIRFWESSGIFLHDRDGYVYPRTDQAATIARGFEKILKEFGVEIILGVRASGVIRQNLGGEKLYRIDPVTGEAYFARKVILAGGGLAGPQYGCDGSLYGIAERLGHSVNKPLPALVPLLAKDRDLKAAAGVRCDARITLYCDGERRGAERGELQITEKGISGIPVFQLSAHAARALEEGGNVNAVIDFLPDFSEKKWEAEKARRMECDRNCMLGEYYLGLVNRKVLDLLLRKRGLQAENKASKLSEETLIRVMEDMRGLQLEVTETGGFKQAQVTSGGIPLTEVDENLMSVRCRDLYLAGELLDVDGICGGYNLQWAVTSGWIAGKSAAKERRGS